ncbi:hypothetical protein BSL82_03605 [Tardibacter chloracetimidivorans]|uniref:C2H2-type domain-containing protein n=1 Tax=Tardibacter chloracetimidivorans TaxID=1921510 RepID=A0A1L3ZSA2_9SPHN|nr:hypothetical protein [Tardibacter chloracetimidivorans]API58503.1 hypothetical protein BSL82_03605 [Tardibacter chloracetimidivorans]
MSDLSKLAASLTEAQTYEKPPHGWTCFHCGETFTTPGSARYHFGFDPSSDPACRIKLGAERGLVMALRKAEADLEEMRRLLHDESCEAYRLYASQTTRHNAQIMAAEEAGYERGLADGRAHHQADDATVERVNRLIAELESLPDEFRLVVALSSGGRKLAAAIAAMREEG